MVIGLYIKVIMAIQQSKDKKENRKEINNEKELNLYTELL